MVSEKRGQQEICKGQCFLINALPSFMRDFVLEVGRITYFILSYSLHSCRMSFDKVKMKYFKPLYRGFFYITY